MGCCGQNRETARTAGSTRVYTSTAAPARKAPAVSPLAAKIAPAAVAAGPATKLHYTGVAPVRMPGPQTGRLYVFSGAQPDGTVDRRDAESLMRTRLFRRGV